MAAPTGERRTSAPVRSFTKRARVTRPPTHWERADTGSRTDIPTLKHWQKANAQPISFFRYNVEPDAPNFDDETYEAHLTDPNWTIEETRHLVDLYQQCSGKWPVIIDRYDNSDRTMEDLKARFYKITANLMQLATPISSMTTPEFALFETLNKFNPAQEGSRKRLAEGHLHRRQQEVDEEAVLLAELQRIMANQTSLDDSREELRRRLEYPHANTNSYQYSTSQALGNLWQQLVAADRQRKNQRLRPVAQQSTASIEGAAVSQTPTAGRPRESNAGLQQDAPAGNPSRLSEKDMLRFGVVQAKDGEKFPGGISFASDRLSKPRLMKSQIQTDKIAAVLSHIGVQELIPLPTTPIIDQFEAIMSKLHTLLDMRKVAEKEEQELKVREAEVASKQGS